MALGRGRTRPVGPTGTTEEGRHLTVVRDEAAQARAREFGGMDLGAGFFGWLVAVAMTILLIGVVGAILTAVGSSTSITQSEARCQAGTIGIATAVVLLVLLARPTTSAVRRRAHVGLRRARQARWCGSFGLLVTIAAAVLGLDVRRPVQPAGPGRPAPAADPGRRGGHRRRHRRGRILVVDAAGRVARGKIGNHYHTPVDKAAPPLILARRPLRHPPAGGSGPSGRTLPAVRGGAGS